MRPAHLRLLAVAGVLAVALGVTTAVVAGRDNAAAVQPTDLATPTTTAATPTSTPDVAEPTPTTGPERPMRPDNPTAGDPAAKAAAVAFLRELGMRDPVAATYRKTGAATAEVGVHPRAGEGDRPFREVTTLVRLHRYSGGWVATGASAVNTIEVAQPLPFARIRSPLAVSGLSAAYEGTVHVTVTEDRRGADRVLGKGFVNGGTAELAPFTGTIAFGGPTPGVDAGWVVFSGDTGADTGILSATAVRVRFVNGDHPPQILGVTTDPAPVGSARLVTLTGSGTLTVRVRAFAADEVRVLLVPTGNDARPHARLLGVDRSGEDGERWSVSWRYPDESVHGHLLVQVNGRGGSAEHDGIAVVHA
jgi:immunoglobulin-like protein involved in spore germination